MSPLQVSLQGASVLFSLNSGVVKAVNIPLFLQWVLEPQWAPAADLNFEPRQLLNATRPKTTAPLGLSNVNESDAARPCTHNSPMGKCVSVCVNACSPAPWRPCACVCVWRACVWRSWACCIAMPFQTVAIVTHAEMGLKSGSGFV